MKTKSHKDNKIKAAKHVHKEKNIVTKMYLQIKH